MKKRRKLNSKAFDDIIMFGILIFFIVFNIIISTFGLGKWFVGILTSLLCLFCFFLPILRKKQLELVPIFIVDTFIIWIWLDSILFFAFFIFSSLLVWYKLSSPKDIKFDSLILIVLTIVLIQISMPVVNPRIEVLEISDYTYASIEGDKNYAWQEYLLSVQPSLWPSCSEIILGYDMRYKGKEDFYYFGLDIDLSNNSLQVCTNEIGTTKKLVKVNLNMQQPIKNYQILGQEITHFWLYNESGENAMYEKVTFYNYNKFPIRYTGNFTFTMNSSAISKSSYFLGNFSQMNESTLDCRINNLRLTKNLNAYWGEPPRNYSITNNTLYLEYYIEETVQPHNSSDYFIIYDLSNCIE